MAYPPAHPDSGDTGVEPGPGSPPGMPRWVKVFGIIALVLALLFVLMLLIDPGGHGPGRHLRRGDAGVQPPAEGGRR